MIRHLRIFLIFTIIFTHLFVFNCHAFEAPIRDKIKDTEQPVVVKGNRVEYIHAQKKVIGEGGISITYGDVKLSCDKIVVYTDTKEAICEGNVKITQPGASFEGEKINYNFMTMKGYAIDSNIETAPFYGKAKRIEQTGGEEFRVEKGYVTTCDLEKPHYRIQAREVQIFLDRKVVAKHIFFYVWDVPVLYLPVYVQPLTDKRPEVTIIPGRTAEWGYYALTAWRYYFNDDSKGFVHLDYREKKGLAEGITYKYNAKELGSGVARLYYAHENDDLTLTKTGSKDDRWRIQYRHTIDLPENSVVTMEFNKLSDDAVIKDYIYREFEENPDPDNYILFTNTNRNYILNLLARKRMDTFFTVIEKLPELTLQVNNQRLWETKFYYFSENSVTNFIRRYDERTNQSPDESIRIDNYHKLSYSTKLFKFLYVTPFVATRQTFYSQNKWKDASQLRSIYEEGVDVSTKFYRIFDITSNILGLNLNRLRHIITPSAGFLHRHQPSISPSNLYQFDSIDDINYNNGFSLSLENKLQTKRPTDDGMEVVDLARLIVSTGYTFRLKKRSIMPQGIGRFGDLNFDLELRPYTWLFIDSGVILNHKDYDINSANIDLYVDMGEKFTLGAGHRYESTESGKTSQLTGEMFYNINDDWKIKIYERYDFDSRKLEEQEYTVYKDLHCWVGEFTLNIRENEFSTWLVFKLKAFPDIPIGLFRTTYRRTNPGGRRQSTFLDTLKSPIQR